jgi:gluconolactonase
MKVIRYSLSLENIIYADSEITKLESNFRFVEGPVWDSKRNRLIFTDIPNYTIYSWEERTKEVTIVNNNLNKPNGLALDKKGDIWVCEHGGRKITKINEKGGIQGTITQFNNKRFNSPNDIVCKSDGSLYFTDPPYGFRDVRIQRELSFQGIYRINPATREITLLNDEMEWPNGLAFSPDEKKLYVADTMKQRIYEFEVRQDGCLDNKREFVSLDSTVGPGIADGLKVDIEGNV